MASLQDLLVSRLENLKPTADGWTAACPICRSEGCDSNRDHLKIWRATSAFSCAKFRKTPGEISTHNQAIRAFIYDGIDSPTLASLEIQIVDPEPRLDVDKVYPEDSLKKLLPDYRYWTGRGVSEDVLRRLEGGLVPATPFNKLSGYFVFPVRDEAGRIMGWTGRNTEENSFRPKHKHLVRSSRAIYPFAQAEAEIRRTGRVVFTEGTGDGLSWASCGMWNWLLLFGLNLNSRIIGKLVALNPRQLVISTNNDALTVNPKTGKPKDEGNLAANRLRAKLVPYFGEDRVIIDLPKSFKDWNLVHQKNPDELRDFVARMTTPIT